MVAKPEVEEIIFRWEVKNGVFMKAELEVELEIFENNQKSA